MDALGRSVALIVVVMAVLCPLSFAESDAAAEEMDGLMLYQIYPNTSEKITGVAVHNYGSTDVDMKQYMIADMPSRSGNEGIISFFESIIVRPGETLAIASNWSSTDRFCNQENIVFFDGDKKNPGIEVYKNFSLSKNGDDVYLVDAGSSGFKVLDSVCYGDKIIKDKPYWIGNSSDKMSNCWIQRIGTSDTDSAEDWMVYGRTNFEFDADVQYDAKVTPFLFPDSGGIPIYDAISSAKKSIYIEIYMLTSPNVVALLCERASEDIEIRILLEGGTLGDYDPITQVAGGLRKLVDLGGDVRLIGVSDTGSNRYAFDHAKLAIIDGYKTIVTSENWIPSNMNGSIDDDPYQGSSDGNRGWGAIIESVEYATFMTDVFEHDSDYAYGDVKPFIEEYPNAKPKSIEYVPVGKGQWETYSAKVTPILSNDSSFAALEHYSNVATTRLYSQQMDLGSTYMDHETEDTPLYMFDQKADTVDTRIIFTSKDKIQPVVDSLNLKTNIKVAAMDKPTLHNKGIISDDTAWVSSVNWTDNSFFNNREVAVAIHSEGVSDYFTTAFLADFDRYYTHDGFNIQFTEKSSSYESGQEITVSVKVTPEGNEYTYEWDLGDGSNTWTTNTPRIAAKPTDGEHTFKVTVTDSNGLTKSASFDYVVGDPTDTSDISTILNDYLYYIIAGILVILGIVAAVIKGVNR